MFKFLKKENKDKEKDHQKQDDDCPMCKVSPEVIEQLKQKNMKNKKTLFLSILIISFILASPLSVFAHSGEGIDSVHHQMMGMGFSFGWIFMILFWALIILGIIWLIKDLISKK